MLSRQAEGREWSGGDRSGVEGTGVEWRGGEGKGGEGRGGQGRAGQGRVPDCLGGLSRVGISSRSTRPWNGQPPSLYYMHRDPQIQGFHPTLRTLCWVYLIHFMALCCATAFLYLLHSDPHIQPEYI